MSRFSNLEFEGSEERLPARAPAERADLQQLTDAREAFERAEFEKALRAFAHALEFNPHSAEAWAGQVRALIELGEFAEANLWADQALQRFPNYGELLAAKAVTLGRQGQLDEALALSDTAVQARDDVAYIWLARGDVLLARAETRADFCFDKALVLSATDWVTRWLAARIRAFYSQFAVALRLVQQALELRADLPMLWIFAANCQRELGLPVAARRSFEQALQLDPRSLEARSGLASVADVGLSSRVTGWWRRLFSR